MDKITIIPEGVCCERILVEIRDGLLGRVEFDGGCDGNGKALGRLLSGMSALRAAELLAGVDCDGRGTSCADQLARGLKREITKAAKRTSGKHGASHRDGAKRESGKHEAGA